MEFNEWWDWMATKYLADYSPNMQAGIRGFCKLAWDASETNATQKWIDRIEGTLERYVPPTTKSL